MIIKTSKEKSWCAANAQQLVLEAVRKIARPMVPTSSNSNANSVVLSLSGSAGATPISVRHATRDSAVVTTSPESQGTNCRSALVPNLVQSKETTHPMARSGPWVAVYAGT